MQNTSMLQQFDPATFAKTIKNYATVANTALSKTLSEIPHAYVSTSVSERIGYVFCDSLDMPLVYYKKKFKHLNPQNIVLINGIFFKNLFHEYMAHLNINFNDAWLQTKMAYADALPMVSKTEYENMPRRYRGIFTPYDSTHYVLHSNYNIFFNVIFAKKQDKTELKKLLEHARILIPMVYQTKCREEIPQLNSAEHDQMWCTRTIADAVTTPAFTPQRRFAGKRVSKQQIDALQKLCDIFTKIDVLTQSYSCNLNTKISSNAIRIYDEYRNELSQSNRYLNAQKTINSVRNGLSELSIRAPESERSGIAVLYEHLEPEFNIVRKKVINDMRNRIK